MRQRGSCKEKFRVQSDMRHGALDTSIAEPELMFSLSSPQEERRPLLWNAPLPTRAPRGKISPKACVRALNH